jgi:flagellar basal body-associated protein FliL
MTADRDALAAQKIATERAAERRASAKNALRLYLMTGLVVVILVAGGIYFYFKSQDAASAAQRDTNVGVNTGRPQGNMTVPGR